MKKYIFAYSHCSNYCIELRSVETDYDMLLTAANELSAIGHCVDGYESMEDLHNMIWDQDAIFEIMEQPE